MVGADLAGPKHRILSAEAVGASTTRLHGYQWRPRKLGSVDTSLFRFRSLLYQDNTAGETTDAAHVTLEKEKHGADFASCWYVSSGTVYPLTVDEIRCSVEPSVMYRSISLGSKAAYSTGTVSATNGGKTVTGTGTAWKTNRWSTGDRLTLDGADYIVALVVSDTRLSITTPFQGQTGSGKAYTLARQFTSVQAWENCLSGNAAQCPAFPVTSASLVADNRIETGLVYDDGGAGSGLTIDGSTTDIAHTITLQAAPGNRHLGVPLNGAYLQPIFAPTILIRDLNVRVEWLVLRGGGSGVTEGAVRVDVTDSGYNGPIEIANNVMVNLGNSGVVIGSTESQNVVVDVSNNVIAPNNASFQGIRLAPVGNTFNPGSDVYVVNNTAYGTATNGMVSLAAANSAVTLHNNIAWGFGTCFNVPSPAAESDYNLSSDASAPGASARLNVPATGVGGVNFTDPGVSPGSHDYHLLANSVAIDAGISLASLFERDWDSQKRPGGAQWDIGADEYGGTTAVTLMSFEAVPSDGAVDLAWRTGSEVDNLGFHVYRALSAGGPWTRLTSSLIPGQGFSAMGAAYARRDSGLVNGTRYFYRLEDVDTKSVSTFHGPVSAVPGATPPPPQGGGGTGGGTGEGGGGSGSGGGSSSASTCPAWALAQLGSSASFACETHGDPTASFRVLSRSSRSALVELETGGFLTARDATGRVRALVPGFDSLSGPLAPALPLKRARLDGVVGRQARIGSIQARDNRFFSGLVAAAVGYPQAVVARDGTV
ncbi:MAG TPA: choice-of-anchor Q domain-containing protein, partial [Vicinamibacteria bacterium]|nr:choice-of-anchor Q domain-containing protein [Vicinamibacteria bacterium]